MKKSEPTRSLRPRPSLLLVVIVLFGALTVFLLNRKAYLPDSPNTSWVVVKQGQKATGTHEHEVEEEREHVHEEEHPEEKGDAAEAPHSHSASPFSPASVVYDREEEVAHEGTVRIVTYGGIIWLVEGRPQNCSVQCHFTRNGPPSPDELRTADAIFFNHPPSQAEMSSVMEQNPHSVRILFHSESDGLYKHHNDHYEFLGSFFNMEVTYHLASDPVIKKYVDKGVKFKPVTITYAMFLLPEYFLPPVPFKEKDPEVLVSIFMSNCGSTERNSWVSGLMKHIKVASFGKCNKNADASSVKGCEVLTHYDQKICVISKYKFYLAFENSEDYSYVTEKLWHPFKAGTVPVYLGAPNVDIFTPTFGTPGKSIVKITDFEGPEKLAAFLKGLAADEAGYGEYLSWKEKEPTRTFSDLANLSMDHSFTTCRICKHVAKMRKQLKGGTH